VVISSVQHQRNKSLEGRTLAEIAEEKGGYPWEILYELLIDEEFMVDAIFFSMSEENLRAILAQDYVMIGTDSAARSISMARGGGKPHPRGFGTYPRILHQWTGKGKLLSLEIAIYKMTGLPAEKLGLPLRGLVKTGYYADLVVFNPNTVQDHADYDHPYQSPTGIEYVVVNGEEVIAGGRTTGKRPGRVVRREN
jgi:N-acyl-D-amino-acid deacylase